MTFLYCSNGCKSIICYPPFYLKLAVACTTEYRMIYKGQVSGQKGVNNGWKKANIRWEGAQHQWCDWYLAQHNWLRADGQSRFSVRAIQGGCKQQIVRKARPCSAWYNLFCWTLMQFFILTKISKKSKNISFFREDFDWCVPKKEWCPVRAFCKSPYLQRLVLQYHIYKYNIQYNNTIFTKSRTRHVIVHVQQSRRNM